MSVVSNRIPFTDVGPRAVEANHVVPATHVVTTAIMRLLISPFALFSFAVVVQAIATFVVDARTKDYRRVGWLVLGLGGMTLALFIPDSTVRNGMFLPFRLMLLSLALLAAAVRFDGGRLLHAVTGLLVAAAFVLHAAAIWDYAATANRQLLQVREAAAFVPAGQRIFQIGTTRPAKFRADPLLHADGYVALLRRGILLSNYEAGHYYFPVKLRPEYPPTLISQFSQLQELDPARTGDLVLTRQFLQKHRRFIDVLIVRTVDEQLARLAQRSFGELLCHSGELWVFDQRRATKKSQDGQARKDRD